MGDTDKCARLIAQRDRLLKAAKEAVALLDGMWMRKDESPAYTTGVVLGKLDAAIKFVEGQQ